MKTILIVLGAIAGFVVLIWQVEYLRRMVRHMQETFANNFSFRGSHDLHWPTGAALSRHYERERDRLEKAAQAAEAKATA